MDAIACLQESLAAALVDVAAERRVVALSGGRDSLTLLEVLCLVHREAAVAPPRAVHVIHGLSPHADDWAKRIEAHCSARGVPLSVERVRVERTHAGLEADARRERYAAFARVLDRNDHLLLAHHQDDQLETVWLRLLRGAGPRGLAGMPNERALGVGRLCRPWLGEPGERIEIAGRALGIAWIEDPSNRSGEVDRAYLRTQLLPQIRARWPGVDGALLAAADAGLAQAAVLDELLPPVPEAGKPLPLADLPADDRVAAEMLRRWLGRAGVAMPSRGRLAACLEQRHAGIDAQPRTEIGDHAVVRHDGRLHLLPRKLPTLEARSIPLSPGAITLPAGRLQLLAAASGSGLRADLVRCELRARRPGELVHPVGRGPVPLKRLLQELRVPPWLRDLTPVLCAGEEVLAIAGVTLCEPGRSPVGGPSLHVIWTPDMGSAGSSLRRSDDGSD